MVSNQVLLGMVLLVQPLAEGWYAKQGLEGTVSVATDTFFSMQPAGELGNSYFDLVWTGYLCWYWGHLILLCLARPLRGMLTLDRLSIKDS